METFYNKLDTVITLSIPLMLLTGAVLICIGLVSGGSSEPRFLPSGMLLVMTAFSVGGSYCQLRTGGMLVRISMWSNRLKWVDKSERPLRYWSSTILLGLGATAFLGYSILILVLGYDISELLPAK